MSYATSQLILESIRTWMVSTQSIKVLAGMRDIRVAEHVEANKLTADEAVLLISLMVAQWDTGTAARYLGCFLNEVSAGAAANAASRLRSALARQPALSEEPVYSLTVTR